jgi:hypothetical protein
MRINSTQCGKLRCLNVNLLNTPACVRAGVRAWMLLKNITRLNKRRVRGRAG